jgi:hypothetical protein
MWSNGKFGACLTTLAGTKKVSVGTPNSTLNDLIPAGAVTQTANFSIVCWANRGVSTGYGAFGYKTNNSNIGWCFHINSSPILQFFATPSGANFVMTSNAPALPAAGAWSQFAAVLNGATNAVASHKLYTNGVDVTSSFSLGSGSYTSDASTALLIGGNGAASFPFDGQIDHVAIWRGTSLSAGQIEELYWDPFAYWLPPAPRRFYSIPPPVPQVSGVGDSVYVFGG